MLCIYELKTGRSIQVGALRASRAKRLSRSSKNIKVAIYTGARFMRKNLRDHLWCPSSHVIAMSRHQMRHEANGQGKKYSREPTVKLAR